MKISEYVSKFDPQNQFEVLKKSYEQIEFAWNNKFDLSLLKDKKFDNILVSGLGGSAISADLMVNFLSGELKLPFFVNRNYFLPSFVNEKTLVIISSYSGNTEETVEVFNSSLKRAGGIIAITTGGKVEKIAAANNIPVVKILPGLQPRYALGLSFFTLLKVLQTLGIAGSQDKVVNDIIELWKKKGEDYSKDGNAAFEYAEQLVGFIPTIYSAADVTSAVGYRFKCQFNENSKLHAFHNVIPELNHNEIIGWESFSEKQFRTKIINIMDKTYHPQTKKRFQITAELASKSGAEIINLESGCDDIKVRLMDLVYLGDWITYYAAVLRNYDPVEIENINILKERLA